MQVSYFTKRDRLIKITNKESIDDVCEGSYQIYLSSRVRGYKLIKEYHGDGYEKW